MGHVQNGETLSKSNVWTRWCIMSQNDETLSKWWDTLSKSDVWTLWCIMSQNDETLSKSDFFAILGHYTLKD